MLLEQLQDCYVLFLASGDHPTVCIKRHNKTEFYSYFCTVDIKSLMKLQAFKITGIKM